LAQICRLATHVRPGDEQKLLAAGVEAQIVRNETLAALAQKLLDNWMTASDDE